MENVFIYQTEKIGSFFKEQRIAKGMTQNEVAEGAGISYIILGMIERNDANPTIQMLGKICRSLDVSISLNFHETGEKGVYSEKLNKFFKNKGLRTIAEKKELV